MRVRSPLPDAVRLSLWFSAWTAGRASLDESRDAVVGDDAAHHVLGLSGDEEPVPLILALGRLRGAGATQATAALPVPGDLLGLAGPGAWNSEAADVEQAVLLPGSGLGLLPYRVGAAVQWRCHAAIDTVQLPDPHEADTALRRALLEATDALVELDVARWRPEVADAVMELRRPVSIDLPGGLDPRGVRLLGLALRCRTVVRIALEDDGSSVTASEATARRRALLPLDHAARRGLVAVCAHPWPLASSPR